MDVEKVFDESLARVCDGAIEGRGFFDSFYAHFAGSSAQVAERFRNTDMERQRAMLKKAFYHLLTFYVCSASDYYLDSVAVSHNRRHLDISPELYDIWLETLIQTVRLFDSRFNDEIELAWRLVMAPGIVYMKFHYDREGPVGTAGAPSVEVQDHGIRPGFSN